MKGRKPIPVADKLIRGNPGKRSLATIVPAPRGGDLICPRHVAEDERARSYWDMYLANAAPGHLAPIDAPLLARLCMALARVDEAEEQMGRHMLVKAPKSGLPIQSPLLGIINRQTDIAKQLAMVLALPPAERNRLGIHGDDGATQKDPAEEFFATLATTR
jgi:hypothetical protein